MTTVHITDDRLQLAPAVPRALATLRRRIRQYVWLEGIAVAAAWLGAAFWGTLGIDWFFESPALVRGAMLAVVALVFVGIVLQRIGRRAFVRMSDASMATVLERRFHQFDDSLLTAVTLSSRAGAEFDREMFARTCREAAGRLDGVQLRDVFDPRPLGRACIAATLLSVSVILFTAIAPESLGTWARRNLAFSDEAWPRSTRLTVEGFSDGVRKVARGADLEIVARADTSMPKVPQLVEVRYGTEGGARGRGTMDRRGIARPMVDPFQEYAYTFRGVLADISFDVVGGDDSVRDLRIQVVDSPKLSEMTLECQLPAYIGRSQPPLPVTGVMQAPMGTRITLHATANKELVRVRVDSLIENQPGPSGEVPAGDMSGDRRGFRYALEPLVKDTTLLFMLTDSDNINSRDPVRLALTPIADQPPQLAVQLDGIGAAITPKARLPVVGRVVDEYGVDHVWFEHAIDQQTPQTHPIELAAEYPTDVKLADAAVEVGELGATPGQKMLVCVKAADRCDLSARPNVGTGERWLLDVVTPEQLRALLESRELVLRQRFERIIQETTETRDLLARLDFESPSGAKEPRTANIKDADDASSAVAEPSDELAAESPEHRGSLGLLRVQGALANSRKNAQEVLGVAEAIDDIRKQLINNRIDTEELKSRLQSGIADPLAVIAQQMFPELDRRLERLPPVLDDAQAGPHLRDDAQQQADNILLAMRKVLDRMIALEDFNEAVEQLRGIIKAQGQIHEDTQQRHKQKIRDLPDTTPPERLALEQRQITDRYKHLEEVLLRMAELSAASDSRRAALLKKAVGQSKEQMLALRLDQLAELLGKDQLSRALEDQTTLDQDLQALLQLLLSEDRSKHIESERARIREYLKRLNRLIQQQKDVQGRTAGGDEAKQLAGEQGLLADKTDQLAQDVKKREEGGIEQKAESRKPKAEDGGRRAEDRKPKAAGGEPKPENGQAPGQQQAGGDQDRQTQEQEHPARTRLQAAQQRMKQAEAKLKEAERKGAGQQQEEAIRELEQAKTQLEQILRQLREEEIARTLLMLEARFRRMLAMQQEVYEGTVRLHSVPEVERTHNQEIEASRLSGKESQIVVEVDKALLVLHDDGSAVAIPEAAEQMREDMQQVVQRLAQANVGKVTQSIQEDIITALQEMLEALKKAMKDQENKNRQRQQQQTGARQDPPLVDLLAELKMIRALQMRVNTRTATYSKMIEGEQAERTELVEALKQLADREQRIHRVTRDLQMGKNR